LRCRCCGVLQDWSDSWSPVENLHILVANDESYALAA
jgi:hypothetical protein